MRNDLRCKSNLGKKFSEEVKKKMSESKRKWDKEKILEEFLSLCSSLDRIPSGRDFVGHRDLVTAIKRYHGTYNSFLKENLSHFERKWIKNKHFWFQEFCSRVMKNYEANGKWSSLELICKGIFEELGFKEREHYWHNYKIQNEMQNGYFSFDFLFLKPSFGIIEADGEIWHHTFDGSEEKDERRDKWLSTLGFPTLRLAGKDLREDREQCKEKIIQFLHLEERRI